MQSQIIYIETKATAQGPILGSQPLVGTKSISK